VAAAGTARVAAALAGVSDGRVATADVLAWRDRLQRQTAAETLALNPELMAGRSDVVAAGLLVLVAALERFGAKEFLVTPGGLRHGLLLEATAGAD
jgi:exopolyphosphatase/pppGpp-phosphohydrolase